MENNKKIYICLVIIVIITGYNLLNTKSFTNHMKSDYFPKGISGKIYDMKPIKGGSLYLNVHSISKDDGITIRNSGFVLNNIKKDLYIRKISNTNKCYIIKGDSIMYFDCYVFSKDDSIKIGKIKMWDRNIINHWSLVK